LVFAIWAGRKRSRAARLRSTRGSRTARANAHQFPLELQTRSHGTRSKPPRIVNAKRWRAPPAQNSRSNSILRTQTILYLVPRPRCRATNLHREAILRASNCRLKYAAYKPASGGAGSGDSARAAHRTHQFTRCLVKLTSRNTRLPSSKRSRRTQKRCSKSRLALPVIERAR